MNRPDPHTYPGGYGRIAYEKFAESIENNTFDGMKLRTWQLLPEVIKNAWATAAAEVLDSASLHGHIV